MALRALGTHRPAERSIHLATVTLPPSDDFQHVA
jgi:hypothetical protein